jgi:transposase
MSSRTGTSGGTARRFPAVGSGVRVLRAVERPRPPGGAGPPAAGTAARAPGPGGAADGLHRGLADRQAHDTVGKKTSGYHGGKKIAGRGRHVAVDTEGWLLALVVTAASVSDKAGAKILLIRLFDAFSALKIMRADTGYDGKPLARYAQAAAAITVEVVARTSPHSFQVLRRRWVVERTFAGSCATAASPATTSAPPRTLRP